METIYERRVISELNKYIRTDDVIVIHGARQVGKTSILMFLQDQLGKQSEKTLYIDLEDSRFVSLLDQGVRSISQLFARRRTQFRHFCSNRAKAFCYDR